MNVLRRILKITAFLTLLALIISTQYGIVFSKSDSSVEGGFSVEAQAAYGDRVVGFSDTVFPYFALGAPDQRGALLYKPGWISIKLDKTITGCQHVNIWLSRIGIKTANFSVYVSGNGSEWKLIARDQVSSYFFRKYTCNGNYGDLSYIKIRFDSSTSWLALIALDAVQAEGGDK